MIRPPSIPVRWCWRKGGGAEVVSRGDLPRALLRCGQAARGGRT
ncbi:hypothetical protein ACFFX0_12775 [Citricoccus parietis]|uniref:Uncharacterized protein n=1 Tax=Citricoccus parietis TaxID=592307 RepID=A0ABV5FZB9_9MICC